MTCRLFHDWGRWTVSNVQGYDLLTGRSYMVGAQWRECRRCGKRQQEEL